jgi:hypothetical protein
MFESSVFTAKITTSGTGPNSTVSKKLYVKVFPGEFSNRPPRPKKAKKLLGELIIRYSAREWPIKKNGSIVDDPGFLAGLSEILRSHNVINADDIEYRVPQLELRDTISITLGSKLAQEFLDRGWASLG